MRRTLPGGIGIENDFKGGEMNMVIRRFKHADDTETWEIGHYRPEVNEGYNEDDLVEYVWEAAFEFGKDREAAVRWFSYLNGNSTRPRTLTYEP